MATLENVFQANLRKKIEARLPGAIVNKNDANYRQGFPDLIVLYKDKYAILECKKSAHERYRPNQELYLSRCGEYVFSATIYPENEQEVLDALERSLKAGR